MEKDEKSKLKGKISNKKEAKQTIDMFQSISGEWEVDLETNEMRANLKGIRKRDGMPKSGLTSADKEWIANLVLSAVKPIQEDISEIKKRLDVIEEDMKNVKKDIKAIKECPTIKKELKKDDE